MALKLNARGLFIGILWSVAVAPFLMPLAAHSAEWSLVGRDGECAPLSLLTKKGPEFRDIESPTQLVEKMRAAGHKAEIKEYKAATRPAVEVRVPDKNLYVMFVKSDLCAKAAPKKK
jgi:hypothetical protein